MRTNQNPKKRRYTVQAFGVIFCHAVQCKQAQCTERKKNVFVDMNSVGNVENYR